MDNRIPVLPLLGEPLLVEMANTLYLDQSATIDFFAHRTWIAAWFVQAPSARELVMPARITEAEADELRHLRDAVRDVFTTVDRDSGQVPTEAVASINNMVHRSHASVVIDWSQGGRPRAVVDSPGGAFGVLLATLAARCVEFVTGPDLTHVRQCTRPECHMLFFQQHHRRRYCNRGCANADRQSRYYRRVAARQPTATTCGRPT
jgi:predicted RNA-binding Zn ribbon-like protein